MAQLIQISDFVGKYRIIAQDNHVMLQAYIDMVESEILLKLFGKDLKVLFLADVVSWVPQTAIYLDLYNEILLTNHCSFETYSSGMKEMLLAMVYFRWFNKVQVSESVNGLKAIESSNSNPQPSRLYLVEVYNNAVNNYKVIQAYIKQNRSDYEDFKGVDIDYMMLF